MVINRGYQDLLGPDAVSAYFKLYFQKQRSEMNYPIKLSASGLVNMLSSNESALQTYVSINKKRPSVYLCQSFHTANDEFKVIEENECVIVPYDDDACDLIDMLRSKTYEDPRPLMNRLQQYSVSVFNLKSMQSQGIV
jgi:hypothetical protein